MGYLPLAIADSEFFWSDKKWRDYRFSQLDTLAVKHMTTKSGQCRTH